MTSVHRFASNNRNRIADAVLAFSAVRPSTDIRRTHRDAHGRGRLALTGPYTGPGDTVVEAEVINDTITGDPQVSEPQFSGIGSGALAITSITAPALPEVLTFTLANSGAPAKTAQLEFAGVTLAAADTGAAANAMTLTVDRSGLTFTDRPFATLETISPGTRNLAGSGWDWGQPAATDGRIPIDALRLAFEGFPQVHRAWKTWEAGTWAYHLDPAPDFSIPAGTRVQAVTGAYALTLTQGATDEVYTATTVYQFLAALDAGSALAVVLGAITQDQLPGGQAVTDIPLRTDAHALPPVATSRTGRRLSGVSVIDPAAPTEQITVRSLGLGAGAQEVWAVSGTVTGTMPGATSGSPYAHGPIAFTPPASIAPGEQPGRIDTVFRPIQRADDEPLPSVCFRPVALGAAAVDQTVTFVYAPKPPGDCSCENTPAPRLSAKCLGLDVTGGFEMALDAEYQTRLATLYEWRADFTETNVHRRTVARYDLDYADEITKAFADCLAEIFDVSAARTAWDTELTAMQSEVEFLEGLSDSMVTVSSTLLPRATGSYVYNLFNGHYYKITGITLDAAPVYQAGQNIVWSWTGVDFADPAPSWPTDGSSWTISFTLTGRAGLSDGAYVYTLEDVGATHPSISGENISPGENSHPALIIDDVGSLVRLYSARMDHVRTLAGIVPKSDASSPAGDGCWREPEGNHWWVDESGRYLPMQTSEPYVSAARDMDGVPRSTQEFGFAALCECPARLKVGDRITITIRGAAGATTDGDIFTIPVLAASPATFSGGANGDDTHTWTVRGSESGRFDDWAWSPSTPLAYSDGPITATLAAGGIPFAVGDRFQVFIEGGRLRWRRDGGAWTEADIETALDLGDGLTLTPSRGVAPSFLTGDTWRFEARAQWGPGRLRAPVPGQAAAWDTSSVSLDADLGVVMPIQAVIIAMHTLPADTTVLIRGGVSAYDEWSETMTVRDLMYHALDRSARYLRLAITGTPSGASIGWWWAGVPWAPSAGASEVTLQRQYALARGAGRNPAALYHGRGQGGQISWDPGARSWLYPADLPELTALLDHSAENGIEPIVFLPHHLRPQDAALVRLDVDEVSISERYQFQASEKAIYGVTLPLSGVYS